MRGKNERFNFGLYLRFMFMISVAYRLWDLLYNFPPFPAPQQFTVESSEEKQSDPEDGQDQSQAAVPEIYSYSYARPGHVRKGKTTRWHCNSFWTIDKCMYMYISKGAALSCNSFLYFVFVHRLWLLNQSPTQYKYCPQRLNPRSWFCWGPMGKGRSQFCEHESSLHGKTESWVFNVFVFLFQIPVLVQRTGRFTFRWEDHAVLGNCQQHVCEC